MTHKQRFITYTKRECLPRVEFYIMNDNDTMKKCSPTAWHKIKLEDETEPCVINQAAAIRYKAERRQMNHIIDDSIAWREAVKSGIDESKRSQWLCDHAGIVY